MSALNVLLAFDDRFWAPAYATMRSVCLATPRRAELVFHLCHLPISPEHRATLSEIEQEFGARIVWHDLSADPVFTDTVAALPRSKQFPVIVYARLLADRLIGTEGRALYLDCDVMVRDDIAPLFALDLGAAVLAAVRDGQAWLHSGGRDMREKQALLGTDRPYFNSGLLLIDLARWAEADIPGALARLAGSGDLGRLYYDQDILNHIFAGRWMALPWRWNVLDPHPAHDSLDVAAFHFTGKSKPWNLINRKRIGHRRIYRHVMTNAVFYAFWRERLARRVRRLVGLK